ncbi:MAG: SMC-Scp complex subunit ScpB, partial [Myxococcales bacterium]
GDPVRREVPKEDPPTPQPPQVEPPPGVDVPPPVRAEGSDAEELVEAVKSELALLAEAARFATPERVRNVIEALLFAADKPLDVQQIAETTQFEKDQISNALEFLSVRYGQGGVSGIQLVDLGGKYQFRTDPDVGAYVRRMLHVKPMRLTRAAMETLAIIAYRQPITRPEMEDLRGVDCGAVTKALLERKLIRILGKKDEPGRPLLYGTTREFLELFNLRDLTQLPTLREFQELSEESRKIVEEEAPPAAGGELFAVPADPAADERIAMATAESDAALDQLEEAMERAAEKAQVAEATLAPQMPQTETSS